LPCTHGINNNTCAAICMYILVACGFSPGISGIWSVFTSSDSSYNKVSILCSSTLLLAVSRQHADLVIVSFLITSSIKMYTTDIKMKYMYIYIYIYPQHSKARKETIFNSAGSSLDKLIIKTVQTASVWMSVNQGVKNHNYYHIHLYSHVTNIPWHCAWCHSLLLGLLVQRLVSITSVSQPKP